MIFVLIQAGEGNTQAIFVAQGEDVQGLRAVVAEALAHDIAGMPLPWHPGNQGHMEEQRPALLAMLDAHAVLCPGRYRLPNIEPQWEEWTLVITDETGAFLEEALHRRNGLPLDVKVTVQGTE